MTTPDAGWMAWWNSSVLMWWEGERGRRGAWGQGSNGAASQIPNPQSAIRNPQSPGIGRLKSPPPLPSPPAWAGFDSHSVGAGRLCKGRCGFEPPQLGFAGVGVVSNRFGSGDDRTCPKESRNPRFEIRSRKSEIPKPPHAADISGRVFCAPLQPAPHSKIKAGARFYRGGSPPSTS